MTSRYISSSIQWVEAHAWLQIASNTFSHISRALCSIGLTFGEFRIWHAGSRFALLIDVLLVPIPGFCSLGKYWLGRIRYHGCLGGMPDLLRRHVPTGLTRDYALDGTFCDPTGTVVPSAARPMTVLSFDAPPRNSFEKYVVTTSIGKAWACPSSDIAEIRTIVRLFIVHRTLNGMVIHSA